MEFNEQNKQTKQKQMHGHVEQTDSYKRRGEGGLEEISQRTDMYISIAHGHRQQCNEG